MRNNSSVVVTGVSTGIGRAIAQVLVRRGVHVFGSVRSQKDAAAFTAELGQGVTPLVFDVTDPRGIAEAARLVRDRLGGRALAGLVNNAGIAVFGPLMHIPLEEFRRQMEVNLVGPLAVTQAFLPLLGADRALSGGPGRIVNIGSIGGKVATPFLGPYCASKFAIEGLSESLRRELLLYGIDVIVVGPGAVATPIWGKAEKVDTTAYEKTDFAGAMHRFGEYMIRDGMKGLPPQRVGEAVWKALSAARPRVRYAVSSPGVSGWVPRVLPRRVLDRFIGRGMGYTVGRAGSRPTG